MFTVSSDATNQSCLLDVFQPTSTENAASHGETVKQGQRAAIEDMSKDWVEGEAKGPYASKKVR